MGQYERGQLRNRINWAGIVVGEQRAGAVAATRLAVGGPRGCHKSMTADAATHTG